jgi:hypothetical protein
MMSTSFSAAFFASLIAEKIVSSADASIGLTCTAAALIIFFAIGGIVLA